MKRITIINGPNLNCLGRREPEVYGKLTLPQLIEYTEKELAGHQLELEWYQTNIEGEIVSKIQSLDNIDALIINPGGYSHTSVAIYDALKLLQCKIIEVHISNTHARDEFRNKKLTAKAANIVLEGLGRDSYLVAIYSQLLSGED